MPVLAFEPIPGEIQALIERRAEFGLDHYDEVWDGVLHIIPPPSTEHQRVGVALVRLLDSVARSAGLELTLNVGIGEDAHNFRTPDLVVHRQDAAPQWHATAALAVEILSPRDTAWHKLDFTPATTSTSFSTSTSKSARSRGWRCVTVATSASSAAH